MGKHAHSIDAKILFRIRAHGRGWVFTPAQFADLAGRATVSTVLKRHTDAGTLRNLARGLYDYPRRDPQLGLVQPSVDRIVQTLAARDGVKVQPSGASAANRLGLTTQVPMQSTYQTDGPARTVRVGNRSIRFRRTTPKNMAAAGTPGGLVVQALKYLGKDRADAAVLAALDKKIPAVDRARLLNEVHRAPAWIADILRHLANAKKGSA